MSFLKTYRFKILLLHVRTERNISFKTAMCGILATPQPSGRTLHNRCRLPIPVPISGPKFYVSPNSSLGELLAAAVFIVIDEALVGFKRMLMQWTFFT